jgi:predicted PhzF superfamily epimerase YddE/YHI9
MNDELKHYVSQYYNPEKAHEYYMKNRQLKPRTSNSLTDEGKSIWRTTKDNIDTEKRNKINSLTDIEKMQIQNAKSKAETTRKEIIQKLNELKKKLKIDKNASKEDIQKLNEQRTKIIAELKNAIKVAKDNYNKQKQTTVSKYQQTYQNEYDKIKTQYQKPKKSKHSKK